MSYNVSENGNGMVMPVAPMGSYGYGGNGCFGNGFGGDGAKSDYERQQIKEEIDNIRRKNKMN